MSPRLAIVVAVILLLPLCAAHAQGDPVPLGMGIPLECYVSVELGDEGDPPPDPQGGGSGLAVGGIGLMCDPDPRGITVGNIATWGQGYLPDGKPNYALNGADPSFTAGAQGDTWRDGSTRKFCRGAVGRCWLKVRANTRTIVSVQNNDFILTNTTAGDTMRSAAWIGWQDSCGDPITLDTNRHTRRGSYCMYLYATTERQGLSDAAGLYHGIVVVTLTNDSCH